MLRSVSFFALYVLLGASSINESQEIQGKAIYYSKSKMDLGSWGARMSEAQKKQIQARLKNRLEKTYTLHFNKVESVFTEDYRLDATSGATDSWGSNFSRGTVRDSERELEKEERFHVSVRESGPEFGVSIVDEWHEW